MCHRASFLIKSFLFSELESIVLWSFWNWIILFLFNNVYFLYFKFSSQLVIILYTINNNFILFYLRKFRLLIFRLMFLYYFGFCKRIFLRISFTCFKNFIFCFSILIFYIFVKEIKAKRNMINMNSTLYISFILLNFFYFIFI